MICIASAFEHLFFECTFQTAIFLKKTKACKLDLEFLYLCFQHDAVFSHSPLKADIISCKSVHFLPNLAHKIRIRNSFKMMCVLCHHSWSPNTNDDKEPCWQLDPSFTEPSGTFEAYISSDFTFEMLSLNNRHTVTTRGFEFTTWKVPLFLILQMQKMLMLFYFCKGSRTTEATKTQPTPIESLSLVLWNHMWFLWQKFNLKAFSSHFLKN